MAQSSLVRRSSVRRMAITLFCCLSVGTFACSSDERSSRQGDTGVADVDGPDTPETSDDVVPDFSAQTPHCIDGEWCWIHPLPHGAFLRTIFEVGGDVFIGGSGGVVHHIHRGESTIHHIPGGPRVTGLWGPAPDEVYAVAQHESAPRRVPHPLRRGERSRHGLCHEQLRDLVL